MMKFNWKGEAESVALKFQSSPNMVEQFMTNSVWLDIVRMYEEVAELAVRDLMSLDPVSEVVSLAQAQAALKLIEDFINVPDAMIEEMEHQAEMKDEEDEDNE